ncbi:MAG: RNA 3'-phosphate cyclase [Myxococcales bacterium]|nr:RNA 3'-phosphate cyclase [Myxococcales bacterium]
MLTIDGSLGEGGGQILRSSLALSLITQTPLRLTHIRAGRKRPGLMRQHLTAVQAAAAVGGATVEGAEIGSREITFKPGRVKAGEFHFAIHSAGSAVLVFQTVLPALLTASGPSQLTLEGGTHNQGSPSFDFLALAFAPLLERMGAQIELELERPGFYPAGGGRFTATVTPPKDGLQPLTLTERGEITGRRARAIVAHLPHSIGRRELDTVGDRLSWSSDALSLEAANASLGPGNVVSIELSCEHVCEVFTGFGSKGVRAEQVATWAIDEIHKYLAAQVPVGRYLADQLILPLAMAGGGRFLTLPPSLHTRTNIHTVSRFLPDVPIALSPLSDDDDDTKRVWRVEVGEAFITDDA